MKIINYLLWFTFISFVTLYFIVMAVLTKKRPIETQPEEIEPEVRVESEVPETFLTPSTVPIEEITALPAYEVPEFDPRDDVEEQMQRFQEEKKKWEQVLTSTSSYGALQLARTAIANYEAQLSAARTFVSSWKTAYALYPVATEIYYYLRYNMNLSQEVACGLLGHMMRESGGHSFDIQWWCVNELGLHYGICQWDKRIYPEVWQQTLQTQLNFLSKNIRYEFKVFGRLYAPGFTYEDWKKIESAEEAAVAFVTVYGRPLKHTKYDLKWRKQLACQAYNFFVGEMGL